MVDVDRKELLRKADAYELAGREGAAPFLTLFARELRTLARAEAPARPPARADAPRRGLIGCR